MLKLPKMETSGCKTLLYRGNSMIPTLRNAAILHIVPYIDDAIRSGDVIVFISPGSNNTVVHRVVSVNSQGIKTKGDNNIKVDDWLIVHDNVIGRVTYAQNGAKQWTIYRGLIGSIFAEVSKSIRILDRSISFLLHFPYQWLARSGIFRRLLPSRFEIKILSINKPQGSDLQLLLGKRVIGQFIHEKNQWQIRRPFRLFINDAIIPHRAPDDGIN